jgi:membrane associated rhomboid family serine protease
MFLPIGDSNRLKVIPFQLVTASLVCACVVVWLYQLGLPHPQDIQFIFGYGLVPSVLLGSESLPAGLDAAPTWATLITYQFLHGGFWHLLGNMLFLWVFGDNVEDSMGHLKFLAFYLLCGVVAGLVHLIGVGDVRQPMVGASGAVSGVIIAYLMLYPRGKVLILAFNWLPIRLPVWLVLGFWIGLQIYSYANVGGQADASGVAWLAHIGGLVAGAILLPFMKRKDVSLFQREEATATLTPDVPTPDAPTDAPTDAPPDSVPDSAPDSGPAPKRAQSGSVPSSKPPKPRGPWDSS